MDYTREVFSLVQRYLRTDRDFVVLIGGYEGVGKSTLAIWLAMCACPAFTIKKDVIYTLRDLQERLKTVPKYHTLVLDEAVEIAFSRKAMHKEQKEIIQIFMQIRQKNLCFIMVIPNINDLDKYFKEHRASRWIEVTKRGEFLVHEKIKNIYKGKIFWKQTYVDNFPPLDVEDQEEYERIKEEAFRRKIKQAKENRPKPKPQQWEHNCPICSYSWKGKENPILCPKCKYRYNKWREDQQT